MDKFIMRKIIKFNWEEYKIFFMRTYNNYYKKNISFNRKQMD